MSGIRPIRIGGIEIPAEVNWDGKFAAVWQGETYEGDTYAALEVTLRKAIKQNRLKLEIPYCAIEEDRIVDGIATGVHARTGRVLARINGRAIQLWGSDRLLRALTPDERAQLQAALDTRRLARERIARMQQDWSIELKPLVDEAMAEATDAGTD